MRFRTLGLILALGILLAPLPADAQQAGKVPKIGFLGATSYSAYSAYIEAFREGLRELGYVEGRNIAIEFRWAEGNYERLPQLAAELVELKVDVLVTYGTPGSRAAKQATTTIPIVIASLGEAVDTKLVDSIARPGGNITGLTYFAFELYAKRLELLRDAFPRARRVAFMANPDNRFTELLLPAMESAAKSLKLELQQFGVRKPNEIDTAFAAMAKKRLDGAVIMQDALLVSNAKRIADAAIKTRIPTIGFIRLAKAGGLVAYGVDETELYRRAATFIDKILKGAKPGDIPIERATRFELIVNLKTAKALGLTIPQSVLIRADQVIQ